jgi:hypothetical protein
MAIKQLVFLFIASIFVFVEGSLIQCSKESLQVNIRLDGTIAGAYTRFWQLNTGYDIGKAACHEIEKKLKYETVCNYGSKSKTCQCSGTWANEQGVNARINACNKILTTGKLVECVM